MRSRPLWLGLTSLVRDLTVICSKALTFLPSGSGTFHACNPSSGKEKDCYKFEDSQIYLRQYQGCSVRLNQ